MTDNEESDIGYSIKDFNDIVKKDNIELFMEISKMVDLNKRFRNCAKRAIKNGSEKILSYILENNIFDVSIKEGFFFYTCRKTSILKILLNFGKINQSNWNEVLFFAIRSPQNLDNIKLLIEAGADRHLKTDSNLLEEVVFTKNAMDIIEYLINQGTNINPIAIVTAAVNNRYEIIKFFLKSGADVSLLSNDDLEQIVTQSSLPIIKLLVDYGVDFTVLNKYLCPQKETVELAEYLYLHGMDFKILFSIMVDNSDI